MLLMHFELKVERKKLKMPFSSVFDIFGASVLGHKCTPFLPSLSLSLSNKTLTHSFSFLLNRINQFGKAGACYFVRSQSALSWVVSFEAKLNFYAPNVGSFCGARSCGLGPYRWYTQTSRVHTQLP